MTRTRTALLATAPVALALAVTGCNRHPAQTGQSAYSAVTLPPLPASLPLSSAPPSGPVGTAPRLAELPSARPLDYGYVPADEDYAWIDRADLLFDTVGDAPPDYGFYYDGVEPWAWETADGYQLLAEPIDDGYRYYYYQPGAYVPFLVRDPEYSYGYGDGRLVAVYAGGRLLGQAEAARQAEAAARYWSRAQALRRADQAIERHPVSAMLWARQQPLVARARQQWAQARVQDPAWREWRARQPSGPALARLQAEHQLRAGAAQRFAQWQRQGLSGPAPSLYPAAAVRHSAEPIMRPERLTLFGAPRPQRQASAAPVPSLPHVQAAPVGERRAGFAQARVQQAPARPAGSVSERPEARRAVETGAPAGRPAFAARAARTAAPTPRQERFAGARPELAAPRMQPHREAAFVARPVHEPQRPAPIQARRQEAFVQRQARAAPMQPHVQRAQPPQQAHVAPRAAPPPAPAAAPHGGGGPHGGPPPQAPHGGGGRDRHDHGGGH